MSNWSLADQEKVESDSLSQPRNLRGSWEADERSSSSHYLDSPILSDHAATAASILEGTSTSEQSHMLSQLESGEELFNDAQVTTSSFTPNSSQSSSLSSTAGSHAKTAAAAASSVGGATTAAAVVRTATLASSSQQPQNSFILSPQPVMTMATGALLTPSTPTVIQGGIQYTLQPAVSNPGVIATSQVAKAAKPPKQQPQLLPKPATSAGGSSTTTISSTQASTTATASVVSQRPMVTMATVASGSSAQQFVLTNPGGMITGTNAPLLLTGQPTSQPAYTLIQQPGGNPILVMRPSAPAAPTLLPTIVSSSTAQGTILLQPPAGASPSAGMITTAQPQIKIITPQGRMQMQQIQTPSGPKLIAVPDASKLIQTVQQPSQPSPTLVVNTSNATNTTSLSNNELTQISPMTKDKKVKKKAKVNSKDNKGLDLGELMKDVGLDDLDGYNTSETSDIVTTTGANAIITSQSPAGNVVTFAASGANQIVAQIPQQIVQPSTNNQYQLIQGPDGQFILQSTPPAPTPTILTQAISSDGLAQGLNLGGSTPLLTASGNLIGTVGLPTTTTSVIEQRPTTTATSITTNSSASPVAPKKSRNPPDPNRTPLYLDERLPEGWHRKVSQRKSGASAGRYEVFIIGPTGKRFRSRNELKAFFEKTGESVLTPEHFDFSTFGTNVVNLPKQYQKSSKATEVDPGMPKLTPMIGGMTTATTVTPNTNTQAPPPPVFKSQLSRETAEADAQISQLLESLQKDSSKKISSVESEETAVKLFNSLTGDDSSSPPPSVIKPQVVVSNNSSSSASKMPIMTTGTTGFQASFLNSITSPEKAGAGNETSIPAVGGASTQRRALQNLPQNTKLVRGPNGQYSLQKVQTIELTADQQNNLRIVQARINELDRQTSKSAKDQSELAQLHLKQQQILASGRPVNPPNVSEQVSLSTATTVVSSLHPSISIPPPISKSIPVPNVTVTKSTPIRYTHTVGNQVISLAPAGTSTTTTSSSLNTSSATAPTAATSSAAANAITQLTDEQKRIVFEFKQKLASLPADQQGAYIAANKGALLKKLNFHPNQLQLLRNNHIQLQLTRPTINVNQIGQPQVQRRPLPVGAGTIRQPEENHQTTPTSNVNSKQKNIAWIENQIKKDQQEALNPRYGVPFKNKDDAIKRLLRYHVFYELDDSPEEMMKAEDDFEQKSSEMLDKYHSMLNRYHFLMQQESKLMVSSSEEVMLARLWDSEERQILASEKQQKERDGQLQDVPLLEADQRKEYLQYTNLIKSKEKLNNDSSSTEIPPISSSTDTAITATVPVVPTNTTILDNDNNSVEDGEEIVLSNINRKRKRTGSGESSNSNKIGLKFARSMSGRWKTAEGAAAAAYSDVDGILGMQEENNSLFHDNDQRNNNEEDDSDEEFTLKDVDTEQAVGSILEDSQDDDEEDDVDDVLQGVNMGEDDVVAAAFGTSADSVQNAINSILDTLPQGDRIETPDINNITGLFDSIEDNENGPERDPITEAAVNSIPQF